MCVLYVEEEEAILAAKISIRAEWANELGAAKVFGPPALSDSR